MELFSISTKEPPQFLKDKLSQYFVELDNIKKGINLEVMEKSAGRLTFLYCIINRESVPAQSPIWHNIRYYTANAVTDTIMEDMEIKLLAKILRNEYGYFGQEEQKQILRFALAGLSIKNSQEKRSISRRNLVLFRALEYLGKNKSLNLEGFIRFWLKDYWNILQEALQKAVDKYLEERDKNEFVRLLKYFVEIQDSKYETVHLCEDENQKLLLRDEGWELIDYSYLTGMINLRFQESINEEDCLLSALITLAPKKVYLHKCGAKEVINTIHQVFKGNVVICLGCRNCQKTPDKLKH